MKKTLLVVVLVILVGLGFWMIRAPRANAPSAAVPATNTEAPTAPLSGITAISISNFAFSPNQVTVKKGTTVTWTNADVPTHTVTSDVGSFDSGALKTGGSFSQTFKSAGMFRYHCSFHPSMHGTVEVTE